MLASCEMTKNCFFKYLNKIKERNARYTESVNLNLVYPWRKEYNNKKKKITDTRKTITCLKKRNKKTDIHSHSVIDSLPLHPLTSGHIRYWVISSYDINIAIEFDLKFIIAAVRTGSAVYIWERVQNYVKKWHYNVKGKRKKEHEYVFVYKNPELSNCRLLSDRFAYSCNIYTANGSDIG